MITNSYLKEKEYPSSVGRHKLQGKYSSFTDSPQLSPSSLLKKSNISNNSEPLNSISQNLSFKGSFLPKKPPVNEKLINITEALAKYEKEFGKSAAEYLKETIEKVSKDPVKTGIKKEGDTLIITPESAGKKIKDLALFPVTKLHLDFSNGCVDILKKIPGIKDSKTVSDWSKSSVLQKRKDEVQLTSEAASVERYFREVSQDKDFKAFKDVHGRLKPFVSNYSTNLERAVTRFVTGMIPAFFLANDAYNLTIYMNNNKDMAKKEKQRRFNQEFARIAITTAMTFGVLGFFARKANASQTTTTLLSSGVVFASEFFGRMMAGAPVLPLDEESAKKYAKKRNKTKKEEKKVEGKPSDSFKGNEKVKIYKKPPEKGALTFENVLKVIAGLIVFGFAVEKVKKIDVVAKKLHEWGEKYQSHFKEKNTIKRDKFNELISKLESRGYDNLAKKYKEMVKDQKGDTLCLGSTSIKWKDMLVNDFLLFPVKFVWKSIILLPWKIVKTSTKALDNAIVNKNKSILNAGKTKEQIKEAEKEAKELAEKNKPEWQLKKEKAEKQEKDFTMLRDSIDFLKKIDKDSEKDYKNKLNQSMLSGLDNVTKSNYSNADLASITKTAVSGITSAFLVLDSYNLVMIDSQGQDNGLAAQKAKERTIQRVFRLAYGIFVQTFINNVFRKQYDSSMLGAQMVNTGSTFATETMERTSVGLPLFPSTRENIIETEKRNLSAKGITGAYYRTMAKLTGKKALSERATASSN